MKRMMSWTPPPSHLMKQMLRKMGPRHKGLESTKWNDEISYLGSEKLMSFWAIFLVLHFASLICGNPLFGCYNGREHPKVYSTHQESDRDLDTSPVPVSWRNSTMFKLIEVTLKMVTVAPHPTFAHPQITPPNNIIYLSPKHE